MVVGVWISFLVVGFRTSSALATPGGHQSDAPSAVSIGARGEATSGPSSFMQVAERISAAGSSAALSGEELGIALRSSVLRLFRSDAHSVRKTAKSENAIVTHICGDNWVPGAVALAGSLRRFPLQTDLVIMVGANLTKPYKELLSSIFDQVYVQDVLTPHPSIRRVGADCVTLQLRAWQLPYKKVLYMDADMVALSSPEPLFSEHGEITAKIDRWKFGWNGGMFICEPNETTFERLQAELHTYKGGEKKGIQQFLNHMFPKCNRSDPVPPKSNGLAGCWGSVLTRVHNKFTRELTPTEVDTMLKTSQSPYESIHFSGDWDDHVKPWMDGCMAMRDSTTRLQGLARSNLLKLWMRAYREFKPPAGMERLARLDCPSFSCAEERRSLDYVVMAEDLDCTTKAAVNSLVQFASPRQILLVAPEEACKKAGSSLDASVKCIDEDTVLPEVTRASVQTWLQGKFGNKTAAALRGLGVAGGYLQQFLKMGLSEVASKYGLSDDYVLWDSGMVLIRDFCPFNQEGQANLMESDDQPEGTCNKNYQNAFAQLTGLDYAQSERSNKAFTAHHMVVNQQTMSQLLNAVRARQTNSSHWSNSILEVACPTAEVCTCGFSEFGTYASWMKRLHPASVSEVPLQISHANPQQGARAAKAQCCPSSYTFTNDRTAGSLAVLFRPSDCKQASLQQRSSRMVRYHPAGVGGARPPIELLRPFARGRRVDAATVG